MSDPRIEMLRQCLHGINAHAAGMQASAAMALRILGEFQANPDAGKPQQRPQPDEGPLHYGDPVPDIEERFRELEQNGGTAATTDT